MQKWMKWESDSGDLTAVPKGRESPGESAPSFSLLTLTPGKFEMNVSDRTELAYHLHKNPPFPISLNSVHLGTSARVEKHFIGTEKSLATHLYVKCYLYLKD